MSDSIKGREPFHEGPDPIKMPVMVGMFDVLGFSDRMRNDGVDAVFSLYQDLVKQVIAKEPMLCIGARDVGDGTQCPCLYSADIRYVYFSDTIILWMPLEKLMTGPFVQRCADLICEALCMRIPLRGAIALGEAIMHKAAGIFLGAPIIDAHNLEKAQEWIGAAFARSGTWTPFVAELSPIQIIEYDVPLKDDKKDMFVPLALDWPRRWRDTREDSLYDVLKEMNLGGEHCGKYDNALAFAMYSEKHHDWHKRTEEENSFKYLRMAKKDEIIAQQLRPPDEDKLSD